MLAPAVPAPGSAAGSSGGPGAGVGSWPSYVGTLVNGATAAQNAVFALPTPGASGPGTSYVAFVAWSSVTTVLTSVVDSKGNVWIIEPSNVGAALSVALATCLAPATRLTGVDTITLNYSAAGGVKAAWIAEFDGLQSGAGARDGVSSSQGTGTAASQGVTSGQLTTANRSDLLAGLVADDVTGADVLTAPGWVQLGRQTGAGVSLWPCFRYATERGPYALAGQVSGAGSVLRQWVAGAWAFKGER